MYFLTIILTLFSIVGTISVSDSKCMDVDCFCDDYGPIVYQCPKGKKIEIEIREEKNHIFASCKEKRDVDNIIPKYLFSPEKLTVDNCIIFHSTADYFNMSHVETLELNECILKPDFSNKEFSNLTHLILTGIELENSYPYIMAPNLFYMKLTKLNPNLISQILNNMTKLEVLDLKKNKLTTLDDKIFQNLTNILEANIEFNAIENVNEHAFKYLKNLKTLNLSNNKIKFIKRSALEPLEKLYQIVLDFNNGMILDDYLLSNFSELSIVHIRSCGLTSLPWNIFVGSGKITEISLQSNYLSNISEDLFKNLSNLTYLDLSNNKLKTLKNLFGNLRNLKKLELSYNEILSIDLKDFRGLKKLKELFLNHNEISSIKDRAFANNEFLEKIDFSYNKYAYAYDPNKIYTGSPFSKCRKLKFLDLSFNMMKDIPNDLHILLRFLEDLNMEGNKIEELDMENIRWWNEAFKNITVNLRNNSISHFPKTEMMDLDYVMEETPIQKGQIHLLISNNPLSCDCQALYLKEFIREEPGIFVDINELKCASPPNLHSVKFVNILPSQLLCEFFELEANCVNSEHCSCFWRPIDRAVIVNCSSSNLKIVPNLNVTEGIVYKKLEIHLEDNLLTQFSLMESYENVTGLFLAKNNIDNVSWIPPNVEVVDISFNNLTSLSEPVFTMLSSKSVENATLGNNPWLCSCDNIGLKHFVVGNSKKIDAEDIKCASSEKTVYSLEETKLCSESNPFITFLVIFAVVSIILLTLAVLYYKYQQEMKVWLYARNLCLGLLTEEDIDKDKKYDALVSYADEDSDFVKEILVPKLENEPYGYKLCVPWRDWPVGDLNVTKIANSVACSRTTLIVMTPNYLKDALCKMEFRMAHAKAMEEQRNRVVIVQKEKIDPDMLDEEMKSYMKTNTYIKWKDSWFWKKLDYALPHKRNRRDPTDI